MRNISQLHTIEGSLALVMAAACWGFCIRLSVEGSKTYVVLVFQYGNSWLPSAFRDMELYPDAMATRQGGMSGQKDHQSLGRAAGPAGKKNHQEKAHGGAGG